MTTKKIKLSKWEIFLEGLTFYDEPPPQYLNMLQFSERAGCKAQVIRNRLATTTWFAKAWLCATHMNKNRDGRLKVMIDWNACGYDFVMSRKERPKDFKQNKDKIYRPLPTGTAVATSRAARLLKDDKKKKKKGYEHIDDLHVAKLEKEKLLLAQKAAEIQLAENEVLEVADVVMTMVGVAYEVKAQIRRAMNIIAPKVAVTTDVRKCKAIMEEYFKAVFDCLLPLITTEESLKDASRSTEETVAESSEDSAEDRQDIDDSEGVLFSGTTEEND